MLDINFIRENPELVQKGTNDKKFFVDINQILSLDNEIRPLQTEMEQWQAERNRISKDIPQYTGKERDDLKAQVLSLKEKMEERQNVIKQKKDELHQLLLRVAQPARADVPAGDSDQDNVEVKKWGDLPKFDFPIRDHIELGEKLKMIDFEKGVKIAGSRSYVLTGDGALLERALLNFVYDKLLEKSFQPMAVPVLVHEKAMEGTGYFPLGRDQAYYIEKDKMALVGTSEVSLCAMYEGALFEEKELPLKLMSQTSCFRREAGTYGRDTRGLYRVHQFQKIEMVIIAPRDEEMTNKLHEELHTIAEEVLQDLALPYRVVYVCKGDLGQGQVRKHDIETWMPSRNSYGETHSCSSFYDFQARRLGIKYRDENKNKHIAYTLNNTAIATPRVILAILENFQTKDGRVKIPACLRKYLGGKTHF